MLHVHALHPAAAGATTEAIEGRKPATHMSEIAEGGFKVATGAAGFRHERALENLLKTVPVSFRKTVLIIRQKRRSKQTARHLAAGTKLPGSN